MNHSTLPPPALKNQRQKKSALAATLLAVVMFSSPQSNANLQARSHPAMPNTDSPALLLPSQYAASVLFNGDFSIWENGAPKGWKTSPITKVEAEADMNYGADRGIRLTATPSNSPQPSSLIYQDLNLLPNQEYEFRAVVAKSIHGTFAFRIRPLVNGKVEEGSPFCLNESQFSAEMPWFIANYRFRTGPGTQYRVSLQDYSRVGAPAWVSHVAVIPISVSPQKQAASTNQFEVFTQSVMSPFPAMGRPKQSQRLGRLKMNGVRGEYEPALIGIHSEAGLEDVTLQLSGSLTGPNGAEIQPEALVVRSIAEQDLLPIAKPLAIQPGGNIGWWLTLQVPQDAIPGTYQGMLNILSGHEKISSIPYTVEVEPYILPESNITFLAYHSEDYFPHRYLTKDLRRAYYQDMRAHGMNSVTIYNTPDVDGKSVDFGRDYRMSIIKGEAREKVLKRLDRTEEEIEERSSWGLETILPMITESGLGSDRHPILWLPLKINGYTFGDMPGEALKQSAQEWLSRKDWPRPLLYVVDEPAEIPERIEHARTALRRIKGLDIPLETVTANVDIKELGALYDVWIMGADRITESLLSDAKTKGKTLWAYACNIPADNSQFSRAMYGFWAYRSGIGGVALWAYYDARIWFADENGVIHGKNGRANLARVCVSPQGPIPTTSWETTREGVNDYRHAQLLDALIEEAQQRVIALEAKVKETLDADTLAALRASLTGPKAKEWTAANEAENEASETYRAAQRLSEVLTSVRGWRRKLIESIPLDTMAPLKDTPASTVGWVPALGVGDPNLVSEHKRNSIRGYIRYISAALKDSPAL